MTWGVQCYFARCCSLGGATDDENVVHVLCTGVLCCGGLNATAGIVEDPARKRNCRAGVHDQRQEQPKAHCTRVLQVGLEVHGVSKKPWWGLFKSAFLLWLADRCRGVPKYTGHVFSVVNITYPEERGSGCTPTFPYGEAFSLVGSEILGM